MNATFIKSVETVNTGGGCMVDLVTLESGQVLCVDDEYVVLYKSKADFEDFARGGDRPYLALDL